MMSCIEVGSIYLCSWPPACGNPARNWRRSSSLAGANGAVNSVAAKAGRSADFVDRICEPAFAAGDLRFAFHEEASFRLPTQSDGQRKGLLLICLRHHTARGVRSLKLTVIQRRGPAKKRAKFAGQVSPLERGYSLARAALMMRSYFVMGCSPGDGRQLARLTPQSVGTKRLLNSSRARISVPFSPCL